MEFYVNKTWFCLTYTYLSYSSICDRKTQRG